MAFLTSEWVDRGWMGGPEVFECSMLLLLCRTMHTGYKEGGIKLLIGGFDYREWCWCLPSQTNILVGSRLVWASCQPGLWDVSCNLRRQVNQIFQAAVLHLPLYHPTTTTCFASREDTTRQFVFLGIGCRLKVLLVAPLFLFTSGVCSLWWWANTCVWWVELSAHNDVLCLLSVCFFFFVPHTFAIICIVVFTWFKALKEKTNKDMSSVSFITGQPVISASAVVSLRRCNLICLSLSKTCLCGPLDGLHASSEIACGLSVCEVCISVRSIVNYELFSHAPAPI